MDEESVQFYQCIFRDLKKKKLLQEKMSLQSADSRQSNIPEMMTQASYVVYPKQLIAKPIVMKDSSSSNGRFDRVVVSKSAELCENRKPVPVCVPSAKSKSSSDLNMDNNSKSVARQEKRPVSKRKRDCERRNEQVASSSSLQMENGDLMVEGCGSLMPISGAVGVQASGQVVISKSTSEGIIARMRRQHVNAENKATSNSKHDSKQSISTDRGDGELQTENVLSPTYQGNIITNEDKTGNTSKCKSPREKKQVLSSFKGEVDHPETVKTDFKRKIINICRKGKQTIMSTTSSYKSDTLETVSYKTKADQFDEVAMNNTTIPTDNSVICENEDKVARSTSREDKSKRHLKVKRVASTTKIDTSRNEEWNMEALTTAECVSKKEKKVSGSEHVSKHFDITTSKETYAVVFPSNDDGQSDGVAAKGTLRQEDVADSRGVKCKRQDDTSGGTTDTTAHDICNSRVDSGQGKVVNKKEQNTDATPNNEDERENHKNECTLKPNPLATPTDENIVTKSTNKKEKKHALKPKSEGTCTKDKSNSFTFCNDGVDTAKRHRKIRVTTSKSEATFDSDKLDVLSISNSVSLCVEGNPESSCSKPSKHVKTRSRKNSSSTLADPSKRDELGAPTKSTSATSSKNETVHIATNITEQNINNVASSTMVDSTKGDELGSISNSSSAFDTSISEDTICTSELGTLSYSSSATTCNNDKLGDACSNITKKVHRKSRKSVATSASEKTIPTGDEFGPASNSNSVIACNNDKLGDACLNTTKKVHRKSRKSVDTSASEQTIPTNNALGAASNSSSATTCNSELLGDLCSKVTKNLHRKSRKSVATSASEQTIPTGDELGPASNSNSATTCSNEILGDACSNITKNVHRKSRKAFATSESECTIPRNDELGAVSNSSSATTSNNEILRDACSKLTKHVHRKSRKSVAKSASEQTIPTGDELGPASNSSSAATCHDGKLEGTGLKLTNLSMEGKTNNAALLTSETSTNGDVVGSASSTSSAIHERKSSESLVAISKDICKKQTLRNIAIPKKSIGVSYQEQLRKAFTSKSDGDCRGRNRSTSVFTSKSCGGNKPGGEEVLSSSMSLAESEHEPKKEVKPSYVSTSSSRNYQGDISSSSKSEVRSTRSCSELYSSRSGVRSARSCGELSPEDAGAGKGGRREAGGVYADKFRSVLATVKELEESVAQGHRDEELFMMHTAHVEELNLLLGQQVEQTSSSSFKDKNRRLKLRLRHRKIQLENLRSLLRLREDRLCACTDEVTRLKSHLLDREKTVTKVCEMFLKLKAKKDEQVMKTEKLQAELDDVTKMFALLQATPNERASGEVESVENLLLEQVKKNSRLSLENTRLRKHLSTLSRVADQPSSDATRLDLNK